ncbi:hypothetical protein COV17_03270 [Candidatus Woesearchaeota archaeon CG10_big_fil_rev_8_21_14_0_10_36_11]|nr:MAG: hypothetical protein COV17_03270 [Candidatus Woesearchaeota archaeon CG10_big_fil_rev_8_21_14_0_10_36_11]
MFVVWYLFALGGAFLSATYFALVKKFLKNVNQYVLASGVFLSAFCVLIFASFIKGFPALGNSFYLAVFASVFLNIVSTTLYYKALKITDLSLATPMTSFTPVFLIVTSFLLLREFPTPIGMVGIVLIVLGSYVLNMTKNGGGLIDPFKRMFKDRGVVYMLIVAFLFSLSSNFDKMVVQNSDTLFGSAFVHLFLGIAFIAISSFRSINILSVYKNNFHTFFLIGLISALGAIFINIAFTMQIVPYVISIKRLSILFSVMYGGWLFKERNLFARVSGALVMVVGVILIVLF